MTANCGVQLFTVRKFTRTPEQLEDTLRRLRHIGYTRFELARIRFSAEELAVLQKLQKELGVVYTASQIKLPVIQKRFDWLMTFSKALGIGYIEVSVIPAKAFLGGEKGLCELAQTLNALGRRAEEHGVKLLYHHHNFELIRMGGGLGIDVLLVQTDSRYVNFVADTYWLARSGMDAGGFILAHRDRIAGIHLRDCQYRFRRWRFAFIDGAIGEGTVDFGFLPAVADKFWSVEQQTNEPFEKLRQSRERLSDMLENAK